MEKICLSIIVNNDAIKLKPVGFHNKDLSCLIIEKISAYFYLEGIKIDEYL